MEIGMILGLCLQTYEEIKLEWDLTQDEKEAIELFMHRLKNKITS